MNDWLTFYNLRNVRNMSQCLNDAQKRQRKRHEIRNYSLENVLSDCVGKLAAIVEVIGEGKTPEWTIPLAGKISD